MLFWSIYVKKTEIDVKISINRFFESVSTRQADKTNLWKDCIQIIIYVWRFFTQIFSFNIYFVFIFSGAAAGL